MDRRALLTGSGALLATGVASTLTGGGSAAAAPVNRTPTASGDCGPAVETFGVASVTGAITGAVVLGRRAYTLTRYGNPPTLGELDLDTGELLRAVRVPSPTGLGGNAAAAAGGLVYLGLQNDPRLYVFDIHSGEIRAVTTVGPANTWIYDIAPSADGKIYIGTYPRGELWEYDPADGSARNLGAVVPGVQYCRAVAVDDDHIYAGTAPTGRVVAFSRADGSRRDINLNGAVADLLVTGGLVYASIGNTVTSVTPTGGDRVVRTLPPTDRQVDAMTVAADGTILVAARPSCTVYRVDGDRLVPVGNATSEDENRCIAQLDDGRIAGVAGSGLAWTLDPAAGTTRVFDIANAGLSVPERAQSVARDRWGRVWVGGHFAITVHSPFEGTRQRFHVTGEPKALVPVGRLTYATLYPSGEIIAVDLDRELRIRSYGVIGRGQQRPREAGYHEASGQLLVATAPGGGSLQGALTLLDTRTGTMDVRVGILPYQSVMSVYVAGDVAYACGDTFGGGGVTPVRPSAELVAFDLVNRQVMWRMVPIEGYQSLEHVAVHDGLLYGVYRRPRGAWFAMDLATQQIVRTGQVSGYGEIAPHMGHVFSWTVFGDDINLLTAPGRAEQVRLHGPIDIGWYNNPMFSFEPGTLRTWGMRGYELARFNLDPTCVSAAE